MCKKYTIDYVKNIFEEGGCVLLTESYKDTHTPMPFLCVCGCSGQATLSTFKQGTRCKDCVRKSWQQKRKYSLEFMRLEFKKAGCELLEDEYINSGVLMSFKCSCGQLWRITWDGFKAGKRCRKCGYKKISGENHYLWQPNREHIEQLNLFRKKTLSILATSLQNFNLPKTQQSHILLGYTSRELQEYIKWHPNYQYTMNTITRTGDKFSIDHIFPIKAFVEYGLCNEEHLKIVNALDNLQPMPLSENGFKKDTYNRNNFEMWLTQKEVLF